MKSFLAVDIGASGGRHILGFVENGRLCLREIHRFSNGATSVDGCLCWPLERLKSKLFQGIAAAKPLAPISVGVDTWGVDYVLLDEKGQLSDQAVAYRDGRTLSVLDRLDEGALYARTGIAAHSFNTIYQLMATEPEVLRRAKTFLMIPDYFHYLLSGIKANEYTNLSTTSLLNAVTRSYDPEVLRLAGIPLDIFSAPMREPGTRLGRFTAEARLRAGFEAEVVLPATHDTGSAFMAVPARDEHAVFLSSGTWSLLGIESERPYLLEESRAQGFTNEGGYGKTYRFLKNIMGLWIIQQVQKEQGGVRSFAEIAAMAMDAADFPARFDANAPRFLAPECMTDEIIRALKETNQPLPQTDGELYATIFRSLADCYADAIRALQRITGKTFTSLNIVGGGSQNDTLNQWTADSTGMPVYAGPTEGTALGNIIAQMLAAGEIDSLASARAMILNSFPIKTYQPNERKR